MGLAVSIFSQSIPMDALDVLEGDGWKGYLVFKDFTTEDKMKKSVEMEVSKVKDGIYSIAYSYPNTPSENVKSKVKIEEEGKEIDGNLVISSSSSNGILTIHAETKGKDNYRKATFYFTYMIGPNIYSLKKEVKYDDRDEKFTRSEYSLSR